MLLDTPKDRMKFDYDCGGNALAVFFGTHGLSLPEAYYKLASPARGIGTETAEAVLGSHFAGVAVGINWTLDDLKFHLSLSRPIITLVCVDTDADHWVVVRGIENGRVHYHDPAYGRRSKSEKAWLRWWQGSERNSWPRYGLTGWLPTFR